MRNLWKKYKYAFLTAGCILAVLIAAFFSGGEIPDNSPEQTGPEPELTELQPDAGTGLTQGETTFSESISAAQPERQSSAEKVIQTTIQPSTQEATQKATQKPTQKFTQKATQKSTQKSTQTPTTGKAPLQTQNIKPTSGPTEPITEKQTQQTCTISISCKTVLGNMDQLDAALKPIIPNDGWILKPVTMEFQNGESAFDLLKRVCRERKIHLEFSRTPGADSAYIEGIANLYEFDCGSLSGWLYTVNDRFLNCSCSSYELKAGDVLAFQYTCKNGKDIGAEAVVR